MEYEFPFEKLIVWQKARLFARLIYNITSSFPGEEKYNLVLQLRRASVSILSNIAEGNSRQSGLERSRFTSIAYGSLQEVLAQSFLAFDLGLINQEVFRQIKEQAKILSRILTAIYHAQQKQDSRN